MVSAEQPAEQAPDGIARTRPAGDLIVNPRSLSGFMIGIATVTQALDDTWTDTTTLQGRLMLTVLQGLAQFEHDITGK